MSSNEIAAPTPRAAFSAHGANVDVEGSGRLALAGPLHPPESHRGAALVSGLERRAQVHGAIGELKVLERPADVRAADREQAAGVLVGGVDEAVTVHEQHRDRCRVERAGAQLAVATNAVVAAGFVGNEREPVAEATPGNLLEYAPLQVVRREEVSVGDQHLRLAEEQEAGVAQREVEMAEDARLRLGREVHE